MTVDNVNIATLIGSRICHDLISPVGAISNGLELLGMAGAMDGPELELIADSVNNANARIRFFRIAFGQAGEQGLGRSEVVSVLDDVSKGGRMKYQWLPEAPATRAEVRLAFLAALCLESALPYGGVAEMNTVDGSWVISGQGNKLKIDDALWGRLGGVVSEATLTPAHVQFGLLPELAQELGKTVTFKAFEDRIEIRF